MGDSRDSLGGWPGPWPGPYRWARLVGFGHRARQGKDLCAALLQTLYPGRVARVGFADALYSLARVYGMTAKDAARLQRVGMVERDRDPDVWVRLVAWRIADLDADASAPFVVAVPDVRFPNEAAFIAGRGGRLVRVERIRPGGGAWVDASRPAGHISETALEAFPWPVTIAAPDGDRAALTAALAIATASLID